MESQKIDGKTIMFPQLRGSLSAIKYPAIAEVKYDGEFNYIVITADDAYTINKYGTMRRNWPALNDIVKSVRADGVNSAVLLCELFWDEGKLGELYNLLSRKKDDNVQLRIFELIELDGKDTRKNSLLDRRELMASMGLGFAMCEARVVNNKKEATNVFKKFVANGYEGVVVKSLDSTYNVGPCTWVKLKFKDRSEYEVVSIDPVKERIGVGVPIPAKDGAGVRVPGTMKLEVGVKACNRHKKHISLGDMVEIEHQGVLPSGSLRHPVLIGKDEWK
jgi:ATP-dependent DNA ligase